MKQKRVTKIFIYSLATVFLFIFLFPLFMICSTSFKSFVDALAYPPKIFLFRPTLENYINYFADQDILLALTNSIVVTVCSMALTLPMGLFAAYALARSNLRGSKFISVFFICTRFIPFVSTLIPIYLIYTKVGLYDTRLGLILLTSASNVPYIVWIMRNFLKEVSISMEEAAWIDGCSRMRGIFHVVLPLARSGLSATAVLTMIYTWNDYMTPMMLSGSMAKTLPLTMAPFMSEKGTLWNIMAAAGTIILLPSIIFTAVNGRNLGRGISGGGVKE